VDFYKFLDIYFAYLGNAVKYNIFKDMLHNLSFISNKLLFNAETLHFLSRKCSYFSWNLR